jgi:hypothetical protein
VFYLPVFAVIASTANQAHMLTADSGLQDCLNMFPHALFGRPWVQRDFALLVHA